MLAGSVLIRGTWACWHFCAENPVSFCTGGTFYFNGILFWNFAVLGFLVILIFILLFLVVIPDLCFHPL